MQWIKVYAKLIKSNLVNIFLLVNFSKQKRANLTLRKSLSYSIELEELGDINSIA